MSKPLYLDPDRACTTCRLKAPLIRFYSAFYGICNKCSCAAKRKSREARPNLDMFNIARARAKKRGLAFELTLDDIVIPDVCPVFGIPLVKSKVSVADDSPTLDRKDPSKGYVKGNVWVISYRANVLKSNATSTELLRVAEVIKQIEDEQRLAKDLS